MSIGEVLQRRISGAYVVDQTGLDHDLARIAAAVLGVGWRIDVEGVDRLPTGGALLVHNRLVGPPETFAAARGISLASGRWVRFAGIPDVLALGSALRKVGGALAHPAEVGALLRDGELVLVAAPRRWRPRAPVGAAPERLAWAAADAGVPTIPVAVTARPLGRWRIAVG